MACVFIIDYREACRNIVFEMSPHAGTRGIFFPEDGAAGVKTNPQVLPRQGNRNENPGLLLGGIPARNTGHPAYSPFHHHGQ